jgi:hypothetical protein
MPIVPGKEDGRRAINHLQEKGAVTIIQELTKQDLLDIINSYDAESFVAYQVVSTSAPVTATGSTEMVGTLMLALAPSQKPSG